MEQDNWQYKRSIEIKNFKDLAFEKERLKLHQKFLGELIHRDKQMLKNALQPKHLLGTALHEILSRNTPSNSSSDSGFFRKFIDWIFTVLLK